MINHAFAYAKDRKNNTLKNYSSNELSLLERADMPESVKIAILRAYENSVCRETGININSRQPMTENYLTTVKQRKFKHH
ncbi:MULTISPECIES: hypothetical protein [Cysteiniphilum]|uniref:Uncharacterized protein n=1 Tax=Cysteiniphilum litorale TaxID=2056700 RepID=A0A8J2Z704_9GAMM|nr:MULTISPECIES: hypothetical protein [Cysteiniphilum]GGG08021.1 hypothetical protein GCM10010995_26980 [Cysteiniphilum litorale]